MADNLNLNADQKAAFTAIKKFLAHPSINVFVLKGYAGTGKTYLMQALAKKLTEDKEEFCLLASTGRAATVLKGKTGFSARTVHSELYTFMGVNGLDDNPSGAVASNSGQLSMQFNTRTTDNKKRLYIVDESSMLSGEFQESDSLPATFGSGVLLDDLFEVAGNNKIIFVGDPCQLPPIGQPFSPALDKNWLEGQNKVAVSVTLSKIERTDSSNDILTLAGHIRNMHDSGIFELYPKLAASNLNNVKLHASDEEQLDRYFKKYRDTGPVETLAIARTNIRVYEINRFMRNKLLGDANIELQTGEVLLVTQNNHKVPLTNGDFVTVISLGETTWRGTLKFQTITVRTFLSDTEFKMQLSVNALKSINGSLTKEQTKELMTDFHNRMREQGLSSKSEEYREAMLQDDYYNCLKATYGYAVTCHKAQGGEWNNVYLFLDNNKNGMFMMQPATLCKWWYTAVTRARKELNLVQHWWVT